MDSVENLKLKLNCLHKEWRNNYYSNQEFVRGDRRGPDPEIPGLKTRNPEVPNLNKVNPDLPKSKKKEFPNPERVNPEIPSLKTPDPGVPIKVLSPLICIVTIQILVRTKNNSLLNK